MLRIKVSSKNFTPRECLKLMGFKDSFKIVVSDTAAYQEAGNSIVVDVLIAILKQNRHNEIWSLAWRFDM